MAFPYDDPVAPTTASAVTATLTTTTTPPPGGPPPTRVYEVLGQRKKYKPSAVAPVRPRGPLVRRNAPCPCGRGKKFKACCYRD